MISIGVIGCGTISQLVHLPIFATMSDANVEVVCDINRARLELAQRRFNIPIATESAAEVMASPGVDAVVIATEDVSHFGLVMMALKSGKHVFVEKPLCLLPEQSDAIIYHANRFGLIVAVGYQKLFDRSLSWITASHVIGRDAFLVSIRDICHDNDLVLSAVASAELRSGEFLSGRTDYSDSQEWRSIVNQWYPGCPQELADSYRVFLNLACHDLSVVIRLFGEPTGVAHAEFAADDTRRALIIYELVDGGRCVLEAALTSRVWFDESLRIYAPTSTAVVEWPSPFQFDFQSRAQVMRMTEQGVEAVSYESRGGTAFSEELRSFVRAVAARETVRNSAEHAGAVLRCQVDAILADATRRLRAQNSDPS